MRDLKEIIAELREKHGNQTQVAKKLGISSQRLGKYENGRMKPKIDFFEKWKEVFGEDIRAIQKGPVVEINVSHETKNPTYVDKPSDNSEKPLGEEAARIYKELYQKFLGDGSGYLVMDKDILKSHCLVPLAKLDEEKERALNDRRMLEQRTDEIKMLTETIREISTRPINIQFPDVKPSKE